MDSLNDILLVLLPSLSVLMGAVGTRFFLRRKYGAEVDHIKAEVENKKADTQSIEIGVMREILKEVRENDQRKSIEIAELRSQQQSSNDRITTLEERERHNLTRVAVHEAWDQIAYAKLLEMVPDHPAPPPLRHEHMETKVTHTQLEFNYGDNYERDEG